MTTRETILTAAAELLVESPTGDVSTRAICERAGIQAPTLYRHFGDKDALLAAVVDEAFERYLGSKRLVLPTDDPIERLRNGWDSHNAWGLANPAYYRIIFSPFATGSLAANDAMDILLSHLDACAQAGLLRVPPALAAQRIMAANVGVTLMQITRGQLFPDPELSARVRDAVHAQVFVADVAEKRPADVATTATTLAALLAATPSPGLNHTESALLLDWLARLAVSQGETND
jgi:AcrR family transcriptional regulator